MDPLFSNSNVAKQPSSTPGGRMIWSRLKDMKCPRCAYRLISGESMANQSSGRVMALDTLVCENPHCSFAMTGAKANSILASMREPKRDVENNQAYLNNL